MTTSYIIRVTDTEARIPQHQDTSKATFDEAWQWADGLSKAIAGFVVEGYRRLSDVAPEGVALEYVVYRPSHDILKANPLVARVQVIPDDMAAHLADEQERMRRQWDEAQEWRVAHGLSALPSPYVATSSPTSQVSFACKMPAELRAVMSVPERPASQLARGRKHQHDWQQWGSDEKYERCAVCGALRALEVKQGALF